MPIVIISSPDEQTRRQMAQSLARKMDCPCVSREDMVELATQAGIPVAKMEMAVLKRNTPRERLARHKARFMAFITADVCQRASKGDLVYHGRACHMLLKRVGHVLRVQVVPDPEVRLQRIMTQMRLEREKAEKYVKELDQDIAAWVHFAHNVDVAESGHYDLTINLEHTSLESASAVVYQMAQLPDFQRTIGSDRAMNDLWLASRALDLLGRDQRTAAADLSATSAEGRLTVTYMPSQAKFAPAIKAVLAGLEGAKEVVCTMASSNILWLAECFDPASPTFAEIVDVAQRWGAGVELMCLSPGGQAREATAPGLALDEEHAPIPKERDQNGWIEEDSPTCSVDTNLAGVREQLISRGCFAGSHAVVGAGSDVARAMDPNQNYALVVLGDLFLGKEPSVRTRQTREMAGYLASRVKSPVITSDMLQEKFLFGKRQMGRLGLLAALTVLIYLVVFTHQEAILTFLAPTGGTAMKVLAVACIATVIPVVAYIYGGATGLLLKWFRFE